MVAIGITGGIGSGKTSVCRVFESLGIAVYYSDVEAKRLMVENQKIITQLKNTFGEESYFDDGKLNRAYLASVIFKDTSAREKMNAIVHPEVHADFKQWACNQKSPYVLYESALLLEGSSHNLSAVVAVVAPIEERVDRVIARDNESRENVLNRINSQMSDEERLAKADYIINNSDSDLVIPQITKLHKMFLTL